MGLYLLNISVDSVDPNPQYIPEDLSINDQESIIEIVFEKILGYENAFEEYDDNDTEGHNKNTTVKIDLIPQYCANSNFKRPFIETTKQNFPNYIAHLTNGFNRFDTPPPKF